MELFEEKQKQNESTDEFICKKRTLFSQLQDNLSEEIMINMIYGQILLSLREKIPRSSVKTFQELLKEAREAEILVKETRPTEKLAEDTKKKRCTFCRKQGHLVEQCYKKAANNQNEPKRSTFNCYGCGAAGYCRSNCPTCSNRKANSPATLDFNLIESTVIGRSVPTVDININGLKGEAYIDTAARTSVAGSRLYQQLIQKGCPFQKVKAEVTLTDGIVKREVVHSTIVDIIIGKRLRKILFIALPKAKGNRTLLRIDFLEQCGIVLNIAQRTFYFIDDPASIYDFKLSKANITNPVEVHEEKHPKTPKSIPISNCHKILKNDKKLQNISTFLTWIENHNEFSPIPNTPKRKRPNDYSPHSIQAIFSDALPQESRTPERQRDLFSEPKRLNPGVEDWFVLNSIDIKLSPEEGYSLSVPDKRKLEKMLNENVDIFGEIIFPIPGIEHKINTGSHKPISNAPYRISPGRKIQLKAEIDKMLEAGIIEEKESP